MTMAEPTVLHPSLRPSRVLAIALAAISPTTSVFLVHGGGLETAGTGTCIVAAAIRYWLASGRRRTLA